LNKKFLAIAITALMIIGLFPALTWTPQANAQAFLPEQECIPNGSPMCVFLHPGVADTYKPGWSHTLGTLWDLQAGDGAQKRQVFDHYLDYAILASGSDSIGDLQFDLQIVEDINYIELYVPPEFTFLSDPYESVWTDITNDNAYIQIGARSVYQPIAPLWTRVRIGVDYATYWGLLNIEAGIYHIRLFNLRAPDVAGLYHFKIYVDGVSIGAENFPFLVVKTELNPAWVEVTVRANLNFEPVVVSGMVTAEGTTPEGRAVKGVAYWGPMELLGYSEVAGETGGLYSTVLFGLAAGTYTITAEASGYDPSSSPGGTRVTLDPGQSFHLFIIILGSSNVAVNVFSKHGTGEIPWHNLWQLPYGTNDPAADPDDAGPRRDILLELYNSDNALIGFWASNFFDKHPEHATKTIPNSNRLLGLHDDGNGLTPTATQYYANLVDNYDLLGEVRMYPSTHWDGHVPWDTADYIAGMPLGQYSVEAFVTGYIMDEADAYQRTFSLVGSNIQVQLDLRRSNWIETAMHLPANIFLSGDTTVTLTAEDSAGNERAAVAFMATTDMSDDGVIDGHDGDFATATNPSWVYYDGGIVIEGWNVIFPDLAQWGGLTRDPAAKDYGLNPTASTHSAGAVSLAGNPYTIKLYMADMGIPYDGVQGTGWYNIVGDPVVSVFLCNTPVSLSFSIVNAWVWISLRSVDFEVPAHPRPWTFPGSEITVEFRDDTGSAVDWLDGTLYGLFQDPGTTNARPVPEVQTRGPFDIVGNDVALGVTPFDNDVENEAGMHSHIGVNYYGSDFCSGTLNGTPEFYRALFNARSTRLVAGEYTYEAFTHGYIMRRSFPVQIPFAGGADIEADMIQGGQIRVTMNFKHEAVVTDFNGFVRVEVFNENNDLVGASIYGQADPNWFLWNGLPVGGAYLPYSSFVDNMVVAGPAQAAGLDSSSTYYPSSNTAANTLFPNAPPAPAGDGQRAYLHQLFYGIPPNTWADWPNMTPSDANRLELAAGDVQSFDVYGFYFDFGGPTRTWAGGWPTNNGISGSNSGWTYAKWDSGLKGSNDIPGWSGSGGGLYSVKVWAFDPRGPDNEYGTADDWRMYEMGWPLEGIQLPWGGSTEQFITMNNLATLRGTIRWFDMYGNLLPLPWAQISASPGPAFDTVPAYSAGYGAIGGVTSDPSGGFIMWLPTGSHDVSVTTSEAPGVWGSSAPTSNAEYTVVVSPGWVGGGDTQLSGSGTPVPELPAFLVPLSLFAALAASVWLLRKRTLNAPILMK
jgi:hypothetical protein